MSRFGAPKEHGIQTKSDHPPQTPERFQAAPENAHIDTDSKDERSIANRLAAAEKAEHEANSHPNSNLNAHTSLQDPLEPARAHGNEPSRGAKIDAQIQQEEEELLRKKNV